MNFFENQDRARRSAAYCVMLSIAVVLSPPTLWALRSAWGGEVNWYETLAIFIVMLPFIAAGCWYQNRKISGSAKTIAEECGGYLISLNPQEDDRWLLDIVEEMAIASGSPVPMVYVLDREGINAFSAGYTAQDSAIGVSYGATVILNREEMQALVAHLFCQIHNNDIRVDARMTGVFTGAVCLAFLTALAGGGGATSGYLFIIGSGWAYLVYLAMSRIMRQRKYLADATAAQFTRNPQSVASMLMKIGGYEYGSLLGCNDTEDFLPMFFAAPYQKLARRLVSPHPPLDERIRRIDPSWDGEYPDVPPLESLMGDDEIADENRRRWEVLGAVTATVIATSQKSKEVSAAYLYQTQIDLSTIPYEVRAAARHTSGAQALIYRLLLSVDANSRAKQLKLFEDIPDQEVARFLQVLDGPMNSLDRYLRLPLFDLCIPALKQLEADKYARFTRNITVMIPTDYRTYVMGSALLHILNSKVLGLPKAKNRYTLRQREGDVTLLLLLLASMGHKGEEQMALAYYRACDVLPFYTAPLNTHRNDEEPEILGKTLKRLHQLKLKDKSILMDAIAVCIESDGHITHEEVELMRTIANVLDCQMPQRLQTPSLQDACTTALPT